LWDIGL